MDDAITIRGLRKAYGGRAAVDGARPRHPHGGGVRAPRTQRGREDDHRRDRRRISQVIAVAFATSTLLALATGGELDFGAISVPGVILMLTIFVLQGVAFGLALLNTPLAIVGALVLPTVWTILSSAFPTVAKAAVWLDLNQVTGPLVDGKMNGADWAHLATGVGFWVVLPLAIGTWRVLTREVK